MGKIAFSIGPVDCYWYGLIVAVALTIACGVVSWQARFFGDESTPVIDLMLYGGPVGLILARVYFVVSNWELYRENPVESLYVWQGGLAVHGALLGFIIVLYFYTRTYGLPSWHWADLCAPGLAIGQAIGQWANFINQEAFGLPTDLPWGIYIDFAYRPVGYEQFDYFQPVFMYESAWNLLVFLILIICAYSHRKYGLLRPGSIFLLNVLLYSAGHFYFEGFRLDSEIVAGFRLGQFVSAVLVVVAAALMVHCNQRYASRGG